MERQRRCTRRGDLQRGRRGFVGRRHIFVRQLVLERNTLLIAWLAACRGPQPVADIHRASGTPVDRRALALPACHGIIRNIGQSRSARTDGTLADAQIRLLAQQVEPVGIPYGTALQQRHRVLCQHARRRLIAQHARKRRACATLLAGRDAHVPPQR